MFERLLALDAVPRVVVFELHDGPKPLSLRFEGVSASPAPVALNAIDPWQTPGTPAFEAVEPCSRPLLFRESLCV